MADNFSDSLNEIGLPGSRGLSVDKLREAKSKLKKEQ